MQETEDPNFHSIIFLMTLSNLQQYMNMYLKWCEHVMKWGVQLVEYFSIVSNQAENGFIFIRVGILHNLKKMIWITFLSYHLHVHYPSPG